MSETTPTPQDEPDEATLPEKPPIENMPPEEGDDLPEQDEVEVPEEEFLADDVAAQDPTVDNEEQDDAAAGA